MILARHDPASRYDRFPQGACPAGSVVCLHMDSEGDVRAAYVRLWRGGGEEWHPMRQSARGGWEVEISAGNDPGLVWYYFVLDTGFGRRYVGKPETDMCALYEWEPPSFQITVYDPAFETPLWMRDSVMMQIMVDRFAIGSSGAKQPHGRGAHLHKSWDELPELRLGGRDQESVDFFGGNLEGVTERLDYLQDLGIGALYLNPIFMARSNHKYDTGEYMRVDPSFGSEEELARLCDEARKRGMHVVLDGVFSHTGADSRYFNKYGTYRSDGAYNRYGHSPYSPWYHFGKDRDDYECWWGIDTLPAVNEMEPSFLDFIVQNPDSVVAHYIGCGAAGWRLDVADELPMEFIRALRRRVKRENADACVIGEVWEDVTNKLSYGRPRCYAIGDTLDSAMNYPLRDAVLAFMLGRLNAPQLKLLIDHQMNTLPKPMLFSMMNLLGSHDKPRVINVLAGQTGLEPPREERRFIPLTDAEYSLGKERFVRAFEFLCHLPGMPCLYYGDDAGLTGMDDPYCRRTYPWGHVDEPLHSEIRRIIRARNASEALRRGECMTRALDDDRLELMRVCGAENARFILDRRM